MTNQNNLYARLTVYTIFAVAFAYVESTIVYYLRMHFYPDGFQFPMQIIPNDVAIIEIGREAATLVMLWFVARMATNQFKERFALFLFTFGMWDIFYYGWLKVFLNWPANWLEWDILFLIPAPWISPWLAPVLVSIGLIVTSVIVLMRSDRFLLYIFNRWEWLLIVLSAAIILVSFFWQTRTVVNGGIPHYYPWWIFIIGYLLAVLVFVRRYTKGVESA